MENIDKRRKNMFYVLVLLPIVIFLLINTFQASFVVEPDLILSFLFMKYLTYLYFLVPSTIIRLLYKEPLPKLAAMRISVFHFVILIFWLMLGKVILFGINVDDWPAGELFLTQFFTASAASYFILTLPTSDYQRPKASESMRGTRRNKI